MKGPDFSAQAIGRIGSHLDCIQKLSSMVAAELVAVDGLTEAQALMAMAQVFIACGAHTAALAARDHLKREPDYWKWKSSCDEAFRRAVAKICDLEANIPADAELL
jgi:hypothetical protein